MRKEKAKTIQFKSDKVYEQLMQELDKPIKNIPKLIYLTGAVQALINIHGYEVPEIELAYITIRDIIGEDIVYEI
jgi:hypothetical protein